MTVLENTVLIDAAPERVWAVVGRLDALHEYDPGVVKAEVTSDCRAGVGASRRCELKPGGWFRERVTIWEPERELAFELFDCSLPVKRLSHRYRLTATQGGTLVEQRMEYLLKLGPLGLLMDVLLVRRQWDRGIRSFLAGLKRFAEASPAAD